MQTELASDQWEEGQGSRERRGSWPWRCAKSGRDLRLRLCLSWSPSASLCRDLLSLRRGDRSLCSCCSCCDRSHREGGSKGPRHPISIIISHLHILTHHRPIDNTWSTSSHLLQLLLPLLLSSSFPFHHDPAAPHSPLTAKKGDANCAESRKDGARFRRH